MGIFSRKSDIEIKEKELKGLVTNYNRVGDIKINARLVVPQGYTFMIGKKGKALDKFESGEHYLNYANLPITCRKFGFDRTHNGQQKRQMPANFYFINNGIFAGKFQTYRKVEMGTKAYGLYKAKVQGVYSYRVNNAREFMQSLLNEFDYIKTGEAEKMLENWVSECITEDLEANNFILSDVVSNSPKIADTLKIKLSKLFSVAGLELIELKITKYILPKQYQQECYNNMANANQDEKAVKTLEIQKDKQEIKKEEKTLEEIKKDENIGEKNIEPTSKQDEQQQSEEVSEKEKETTKTNYYAIEEITDDLNDAQELLNQFGIGKKQNIYNNYKEVQNNKEQQNENADDLKDNTNLEISKENLQEDQLETINDITSNQTTKNGYVPFGSFIIEESNESIKNQAQIKLKEKTFVDLSFDGLYTTKENTKRCLNCGAENNKDANHCLLCGECFNKGDNYENN